MNYFPKTIAAVAVLIIFLFGFTALRKKPDSPQAITISALKMNVLYAGVENAIGVQVPGSLKDSLVVTVSEGTIAKTGDYYAVKVNKPYAKVFISVSRKKRNGKTEPLASKEFRVKRIPDPVAYFGNVHNEGAMTVDQMHKELGIFARMVDFDFDLRMSIVSFKMSVNKEGKWKEYEAKGPSLTNEMKRELTYADHGDRILFTDINVQAPDTTRRIAGIVITVK